MMLLTSPAAQRPGSSASRISSAARAVLTPAVNPLLHTAVVTGAAARGRVGGGRGTRRGLPGGTGNRVGGGRGTRRGLTGGTGNRRGLFLFAASSGDGKGEDWRLPGDKIFGVDGLLSTQPDEVVVSALEAFRVGDIFAVLPVLRQPPEYSGAVEDYWSSEGPWGMMTTVARRVLPEHSSSNITSCLSFGGRNLQRVVVTGTTGESATLLWNLVYEEGRWQVASIGGEPEEAAEENEGHPSAPSPTLSPEKVVLAQLSALKLGDYGAVSRLSSPKLVASQNLSQFKATLHRGYRNLVWHAKSRIIHQTQIDAGFVMVTVAVTAGGVEGSMPGRAPPDTEVYTWLLSLQQSGPCAGCWLTDSLSRDPLPLEQLKDGEV